MPNAGASEGVVLPLRDARVRDLVFYRYRHAHQARPTWKQIGQAMAEVRGKLFETWDGCLTIPDNPTMRVMLKAGELKAGWVGSAGELLELLSAVNHANGILAEGEKLPENEDMMGIWLRDNYGRLAAHGIKLTRPQRRARKRLWAWRKVTTGNDTCDTTPEEVSLNANAPNPKVENKNRPIDTHVGYTEEEQALLDIITTGEQK